MGITADTRMDNRALECNNRSGERRGARLGQIGIDLEIRLDLRILTRN